MGNSENKSKRVTIKQVAEQAGVTIGTVSHVINGTAPISAETTARVREAIELLQYVPNMTAKSLRSKRSKVVGILVPNLNNNFYSKILSTFVNLAFENGYIVQIFGYEYSVEKELQAINSLASNSVDIVIIMNGHDDEEGIQRLLDVRKKVILADRYSDIKGVKCLFYDNQKGVFEAVGLLKEKGYQNIGLLSEPGALINVHERFVAYKDALQAYGLPYREEHVHICDGFRLDALVNGYQYVKNMLGHKGEKEIPDAFLATSDLLAIGAIKAFDELGYKVPGDVGIISFDNLDIASFVKPGLTTIEQNQAVMGKELFRVVKAVSEEEAIEDKIVLSQKLIIRESC